MSRSNTTTQRAEQSTSNNPQHMGRMSSKHPTTGEAKHFRKLGSERNRSGDLLDGSEPQADTTHKEGKSRPEVRLVGSSDRGSLGQGLGNNGLDVFGKSNSESRRAEALK